MRSLRFLCASIIGWVSHRRTMGEITTSQHHKLQSGQGKKLLALLLFEEFFVVRTGLVKITPQSCLWKESISWRSSKVTKYKSHQGFGVHLRVHPVNCLLPSCEVSTRLPLLWMKVLSPVVLPCLVGATYKPVKFPQREPNTLIKTNKQTKRETWASIIEKQNNETLGSGSCHSNLKCVCKHIICEQYIMCLQLTICVCNYHFVSIVNMLCAFNLFTSI